MQKYVIFYKKVLKKLTKSKNYAGKYRGAIQSICDLKSNVLNEISVVFHNGSNYDYHIFKKELASKFGRQFACLVENTDMY